MAKVRLITRKGIGRLGALLLVLLGLGVYAYFAMIHMPGKSFRGALPGLTDSQRALAEQLRSDVERLSDAPGGVGRAGNRSTYYPKRFAEAAAWIHDELRSAGYKEVVEVFVERGAPVPNMEVAVAGTMNPREILVIGAHYDAFQGTPGADDNASGVAACLYLARAFAGKPRARTIRFCFFVNEEPPAFQTSDMGSWVYARRCRERKDDIVAMLSIESIGYYSDERGSQQYPSPLNRLYPDRGNFVAFVSEFSSRALNKRATASFREHTRFPSEGWIAAGVASGCGLVGPLGVRA